LTARSETDTEDPVSGARKTPGKQTVFFGKGLIVGIAGILALLIIVFVLSTYSAAGMQGFTVPPQACSDRTITYINSFLVQPGTTASVISVTVSHGLYEVKILYDSKEISLYTSPDCSLLFPAGAIDISASPPAPAPSKTPVKSARPDVALFVMSFCPYGTQAETVMRPVRDLLGEKADIRVRYITTVRGDTIDSVDSLHGIAEAKENAFQLCTRKTHPELYWEYLQVFNEQCYPGWYNSAFLETCRQNVTTMLKIDHDAVSDCAAGAGAITLLKADQAESGKYGAGSSPTLIVNGIEYTGARTPESYKQFICNSFETAPEECGTELSSSGATTSGDCG
jgi:glutaredoxin